MFIKETKHRTMALAVVAMFILSAFAVVLAPMDAGETGTDAYTVNMRVGDVFDYSPKANVQDTAFSWEMLTQNPGESYTNTAVYRATPGSMDLTQNSSAANLMFKPTKSGETVVKLTASHTASSQTVYQTITFNVIEKMTFEGSFLYESPAQPVQLVREGSTATASMIIPSIADHGTLTVTANNGSNPEFDLDGKSIQFMGPEASSFSSDNSGTFTVVAGSSNNQFVASLAKEPTVGTYKVTVPVSWSVSGEKQTTAGEEMNVVILVTVTSDVSIEAGQTMAVVVGQNATKEINLENDEFVDDITFDVTDGDSAIANKITESMTSVAKSGKAVLAVDATQLANTDITNGSSVPITLNVAFSGHQTINGEQDAFSGNGTVALTIYKALAFTTTPVINGDKTVVYASSTNGMDILLTTTIAGANKITYDWGDGHKYTKNVTAATSTYYSASHTYAQPGTYFIKITAENDFGEASYITPYTTTFNVELDKGEQSIKAGPIKATEADGKITLVSTPVIKGIPSGAVTFEWSFQEKDGEKTKITSAVVESTEWIDEFDSSNGALVLIKDKVKDDTKLFVTVSVTFAGETEPVKSDEASYIVKDTRFLSQNGWILWALPIVFVALLIIAVLVTGPTPVVIIPAAIVAVVEIALLVCRFMGVL